MTDRERLTAWARAGRRKVLSRLRAQRAFDETTLALALRVFNYNRLLGDLKAGATVPEDAHVYVITN